MRKDGFKEFGRKDRGIEIVVDVRTCDLRLSEVMKVIEEYKEANPDKEVWLDGDMYAIVSMPREAVA
jgi:ABC-type sugar transport system substrate-binding protein